MPSPQATPIPSGARRLELDWLRVAAFGLLILYHIGMFYVTWDFHVKSPRASDTIEPLMLLVNPWRLDLLFLISGCATAFFLKPGEAGLGRTLRSRSARLLIPLVFGMLVIVPPQSYYQVVETLGYSGGLPAFWDRYLHADHSFCKDGKCLILPTWNHLWFVAYLWVYTMVLAALIWVAPDVLVRARDALRRALDGAGLVVVPWLLLAALRILMVSRFPSTHALVDDWFNHATYLVAFLMGYVISEHLPSWERLVRWRWRSLAAALLSYGLLRLYFSSYFDFIPEMAWLRMLQRIVYAGSQWAAIMAALGWARALCVGRADSRVRRYLTDGVFCFYIVHQTAIIVTAHNLAGLALPLPLEAALVVVGTLACCFLSYEVARRVSWLRPLFGIPARVAAKPRTAGGHLGFAGELCGPQPAGGVAKPGNFDAGKHGAGNPGSALPADQN
jgi:hypothetical protein